MQGSRVLPAAAYLEMAVTAAAITCKVPSSPVILRGVGLAQPLRVDNGPREVHIGLLPETGGDIGFAVYSDQSTVEPTTHSEGTVSFTETAEVAALDLAAIRSTCDGELTAEQCYAAYHAAGIAYGPAHRAIEHLWTGAGQALARLALPDAVAGTDGDYTLHPSLIDAALQASIGVLGSTDAGAEAGLLVPFSIDEVLVLARSAAAKWVSVRPSAERVSSAVAKLDLDLTDEHGNVLVRLRGLSFRVLAGGAPDHGPVLLAPEWAATPATGAATDARAVVVVPDQLDVAAALAETGTQVTSLTSAATTIDGRYADYVVQLLDVVRPELAAGAAGTVLIQLVLAGDQDSAPLAALLGVLRTAVLENPRITAQAVVLDPEDTPATAAAKVAADRACPEDTHVRHHGGTREVLTWVDATAPDTAPVPWKERGVYLITGGAGALGQVFARDIATEVHGATLVLTGRSPLDEGKRAALADLEALGAHVHYERVDVADRAQVDDLVARVLRDHGRLDGVLHSAGITRDAFLVAKQAGDVLDVLAPKVSGVVNLDEATRDLPLDCFVAFASTAGAHGNAGQADYAAANAFLDAYLHRRQQLVARGERAGRGQSIDWPLWTDGGMHVPEGTEALLRSRYGIVPLATADGVTALRRVLGTAHSQVLVLAADTPVPATVRANTVGSTNTDPPEVGTDRDALDRLDAAATEYVKGVLSRAVKLPADRIDARTAFEGFGVDSVMAMSMTAELEADFGPLPKTLFFEFGSVRELTRFFLTDHHARLVELVGATVPPAPAPAPAVPAAQRANRLTRFAPRTTARTRSGAVDVAVIGVAGRYPGARTLTEFWANLVAGKDNVTEVPADRWDHSRYFDADKDAPGKTYSKWGGFLDGVAEFDAQFFHIAPREAELMDPQERLFLQCVHDTIEDAGYTAARLRGTDDGDARRVGVFAGVMYEEYQLYGAQEQALGRPVALSGNPSAVANRVSYYFDFHGPSMSVDTMCSSSLTAIHLACQSIASGTCEVAVAGGVNLSTHPNKYLLLGQGRFVSSVGRCESFGAGGDGYVPGEGVGAVLLKPLERAIADGDRIHGVIKAVAVNHGGKTNGYTVPSPRAQARSIGDAWRQAGIDPRSVGYVEAHGTGTSLGDPIEVSGLTKAFREHTVDTGFCALGSVKSNIGHCESAAGIAGLTKVLLQLKHGTLVPSLHSAELNPHIDFAETPFTVQRELAEWPRPTVAGRPAARLAGISAFGAGGSNAHLVIEEYLAPTTRPAHSTVPALVVLSARDADRLRVKAADLAAWIETDGLTDADLPSLARTLQLGREPMRERLALVATSMADLAIALRDFGAGHDVAELRTGRVNAESETAELFADDDEFAGVLAGWLARGRYAKVLGLWVKGADVDWDSLYGVDKPALIGLPAYPFNRDRHWITTGALPAAVSVAPQVEQVTVPLVFTEQWSPADAVASGTTPATVVCLCTDPATREQVRRGLDAATTVVFGADADVLATVRHGSLDAVLDLRPLDGGVGPHTYSDVVRLVEAVSTTGARRVVVVGEFGDGVERAYLESLIGFERSLPNVLPAVALNVLFGQSGAGTGEWVRRLSVELSAETRQRAVRRRGPAGHPAAAERPGHRPRRAAQAGHLPDHRRSRRSRPAARRAPGPDLRGPPGADRSLAPGRRQGRAGRPPGTARRRRALPGSRHRRPRRDARGRAGRS